MRLWVQTKLLAVVVGLLLATPVAATAANLNPAAGPNFEMPFLCGEKWTGTSRSYHSPSRFAVDFNAPNDNGHIVVATAAGTVSKVVFSTRSYGVYVVIDHGNGVSSLYAHLQTTWLTVGMRVDQGQAIGLLGSTGNSSGPHLHHEEKLGSTVIPPYFHRTLWKMGSTAASQNCPDTPLIGDWDGNGTANVGIVRRTPTGTSVLQKRPKSVVTVPFGTGWDTYLAGDFDADPKDDLAVRSPNSSIFRMRTANGATSSITYGTATLIGLVGDWDGNGLSDVGTWRYDLGQFALRMNGKTKLISLPNLGDRPVTGDWDGDKLWEVGVYDSDTATFSLRSSSGKVTTIKWGSPGDIPVSGDWNGDGRTDVGVWTPTTATFALRFLAAGSNTTVRTKTIVFGNPRAL